MTTYIISIVGIVFLAAFGGLAVSNGNTGLASYLLIPMALGMLNIGILLTRFSRLAIYNLVLICAFLCLMLIAAGGHEQTGMLWTYPIVTIAIAVLSYRLGVAFCVAYLATASTIMLLSPRLDAVVNYETSVAVRYVFSCMALCVIALAFVRIQDTYKNKLAKKTVTDELTGLYNRSVMATDRRSAYFDDGDENKGMSLLLIDIDHFKDVNDQHGHLVGDEVIKAVAAKIKEEVRDSDLVIRWGGEEFLAILKNCSQADAVIKANGIASAVKRNPGIIAILGRPLTISIGVSALSVKDTLHDTLKVADANLYKAKETGRDKVVSE